MENQEFQTCPCCNGNPKHKAILIAILDFIAKESKQIHSDYLLQNAIANVKVDEMDDKFKKGNLLEMLVAFGNGVNAVHDFEERMIMLKGRLGAFEDIANKFKL